MAMRNRWMTPLFLAAGLALSAQGSDRASKDFKARIVKGEGPWLFRAWTDGSLQVTKVEVFDAQGKRVQLLKMNQDEMTEGIPVRIAFDDFNFDGNKDLMILASHASADNAWYAIYLFDPQSRRFVHSKELSDLTSPDTDDKNRTITSNVNLGGAGCFYDSKSYQWIGGRLTLIGEDTQDDKTHESWELKGGKLVLVLKEKSHCGD